MTVINFCEEDRKLRQMVKTKNLSDSRKRTINIAFNEIYNEFDYTPSELLKKAREDEVQYIEKGIIKQKALDDRIVSIIQEDYKDYLETKEYRGRNLLPRTIQLKLIILRSFLNSFGIELPKMPKIPISKSRPTDEDIPSWEDVNDALPNCKSPRDKAILAYAVTTGLRVSDIVSRKICHLVQACNIYFEENEEHTLDNLLKKDASQITPCWELMPQKAAKYENNENNYTITFNTPETTEFIFKYLKYRIDLDIKNGGDGKIDSNEALFRSQRKSNVEGHLPVSTVEYQFREINKKLGGEKQKNRVYAKFSPHSLRKLFKTTCTRYLSESYINSNKIHIDDIASILTGHSSDKNNMNEIYVAIQKEDGEDNFLRKAYESLIPHLSIRPTKLNVVSTKEYKDLQEENKEIRQNYEDLEKSMNIQKEEYEQRIRELESVNSTLSSQITDIQNQVDNIINVNDISKIQDYIASNELVNKYNLSSIIIDFYKEDIKKDNFEGVTESYIDDLIMIAYNRVKAKKITAHVEIYDDENWKEIQKDIELVYRDYMWNLELEMTDGLKNKLDNKLEEYSKELWLNKSKVDKNKVVEIIDSVLLR